jgi:hypothetical protein
MGCEQSVLHLEAASSVESSAELSGGSFLRIRIPPIRLGSNSSREELVEFADANM